MLLTWPGGCALTWPQAHLLCGEQGRISTPCCSPGVTCRQMEPGSRRQGQQPGHWCASRDRADGIHLHWLGTVLAPAWGSPSSPAREVAARPEMLQLVESGAKPGSPQGVLASQQTHKASTPRTFWRTQKGDSVWGTLGQGPPRSSLAEVSVYGPSCQHVPFSASFLPYSAWVLHCYFIQRRDASGNRW